MVAAVDRIEPRWATSSSPRAEGASDDALWSTDELTSFMTHPGVGRVLSVRAGSEPTSASEAVLRESGYLVGRLRITRESGHLPQAAATFLPDVIYVDLGGPATACIDVLETFAGDRRTEMFPLVALVPAGIDEATIEAAYSRSGCDFLRADASRVELLARTHLLVRLARAMSPSEALPLHRPPEATAANAPGGERVDLWDPETGACAATYLHHRLPLEVSRARRYQRPLSVLAVRCSAAGRDPAVAAWVARQLRDAARDVDLVARSEPDLFVLVLPETDVRHVEPLRARIARLLDEAGHHHGSGAAGLDLDYGMGGAYSSSGLLLTAARAAERG
jgi:GGDEF domain-containing protein